MTSDGPEDIDDHPVVDVAGAARGWHRIQLGALGFIGLCGVLSDVDATAPRWLQVAAMGLALAALAVACLAILVVAGVAWPVQAGVAAGASARRADSASAVRRLRAGVALTYLAVALMALAASAGWWPNEDPGAAPDGVAASVRITDASGQTACGRMLEGREGWVRLATIGGDVEVPLRGLADISPADAC